MSTPVTMTLFEFQAWATAPAPDGIDPQIWADAQRTRAERARPWDESALERLPHYMSGLAKETSQGSEGEALTVQAA